MSARFLLASALFAASAHQTALAVQASPHPFTVSQPDGSEVTLYVRGSEHFNYYADENNFPVVQISGAMGQQGTDTAATASSEFVFAQMNEAGQLQATPFRVGSFDPTLLPGLSPLATVPKSPGLVDATDATSTSSTFLGGTTGLGLYRRRRSAEQEHHSRSKRTATNGTITNLVLMIRWSDSPYTERSAANGFVGLPTVQDLDPVFNGANNSVRDVYLRNSYNRLTINSVFTGWITVSVTEAFAANGQSGLTCCNLQQAISEALSVAQARGIRFASFDQDRNGLVDMISVIHSGYAAEWGGATYLNRIWSHQWTLRQPWVSTDGVRVEMYTIAPALYGTSGTVRGRVGVIAHELGHFLGLPDLYDADGPGYGRGLGSYSLMANSWGFDSSQNSPPLLDAWSKIRVGWGFPAGEYLLIENRQRLSYDVNMPLGGLAIYHVNELSNGFHTQGWPGQAGWPLNGNHYRVALLQADGLFQLESTVTTGDRGDLWSLTGAKFVLNSTTVPNTRAYQFGNIRDSGVAITVTTLPGAQMSFRVTLTAPTQPSVPTVSSTVAPVVTSSARLNVTSTTTMSTSTAAPANTTIRPTTSSTMLATNSTIRPTSVVNATTSAPTVTSGLQPTAPITTTRTSSSPTPKDTTTARTTKLGAGSPKQIAVRQLIVRSPLLVAANAYRGVATIVVRDAAGRVVPGVTVSGRFIRSSGRISENVSAVTGRTGATILRTSAAWALLDRTLQFCVTTIGKSGYAYDERLNSIVCATLA